MSTLKGYVTRTIQAVSGKLGIDLTPLPNRSGVQLAWRSDGTNKIAYISTVRGVRFLVCDTTDYIQRHHLQGSFYAERELELLAQYFRGGTFLDVGANVGNHSLYVACILGAAKVIAIEPLPAAYRVLRCNIALNDLPDVVHHFAVGLSDTAGLASAQTAAFNLGNTKLTRSASGDIEIRPGDELVRDENVSFIKVDVEGLELEVLHGLQQTILRCRPTLLVEVEDGNIPNFKDLLGNWQYTVSEKLKPYPGNTYFLVSPHPV